MFMKKNFKAVSAFVMALCMCVAFSGCGDSADDNLSQNSSSSIATGSSNTESQESEEESTTEPTTEEATEPPTEDNNALYAYYDDLAKEYEEYGEGSFNALYAVDLAYGEYGNPVFLDNGKVIVYSERNIITYDIASKETKTLMNRSGRYYYSNGYIYEINTNNNGVFNKYDLDGNLVQTLNDLNIEDDYFTWLYSDVKYITENGIVFVDYTDEGTYMISSDFKNVTKIPNPTVEAEHGLTKDIQSYDYEFIAEYDNKVYATAYDNGNKLLFSFNPENMEWNLADELDEQSVSIPKLIGKYLVGENSIYDIEKHETVAQVYGTFANSYHGGNYSFIQRNNGSDNGWYKVQFPNDGSEINYNDYEQISKETTPDTYIYPLDDTYYVVMDSYGIFLRTYEKGEAEEETIMLFEN